MKRLALAIGILFAACGGTSSKPLGHAGTSGQDASGAAGSGAAGTSAADARAADASAAGAGAAGTSANTDAGPTYVPGSVDGRCVSGAFRYDGGSCRCQPDIPLVCSLGCTNEQTDNDNCGRCDNKCGPTSTCVAGTCSPAPALVVPAAPGCTTIVGLSTFGLSIAISGATIYVADAGHGTVTSQPVGGGAVTIIASGEMAPHALAVAGPRVAWIDWVAGPNGDAGLPVITGTLRTAGAAAGAATTLATGVNEFGGIRGVTLSADGDTVYYSTNTSIMSVPITGGTPTTVANTERSGPPGALALDGTKLAFPTEYSDINVITLEGGKVARCGFLNAMFELEQINCLRIWRGPPPSLSTILARADRVYFVTGTNLMANEIEPPMVGSRTLAQSSRGEIRAMAMSADKIYFVDDDLVERTGLVDASPVDRLARAQNTPASVAVGATKVYWGNDGDCTVASTDL